MRGNTIRAAALLAGLSVTVVACGWILAGRAGLQIGIVTAIAGNGMVFFFADTLVLRAMHARPVSEIEQPDLYALVGKLATQARQPMPRVYLSPTPAPNAFAVGRTQRRAGVCCTTGLLRLLNERELRAVLAHELAHIRRGDTLVSSVAATLGTLITSLTALALLLPLGDSEDEDVPNLLGGLLFLLLGPLAAAVIHASGSRAREHRADEEAAQLTGDPMSLVSALRKIQVGAGIHTLPANRELLSAAHLMITHPFPRGGMGRLFAAHPPLAERVDRLRRMAGL
ncbi:M48 family metalloprotease [Salinactinospora qingdaonensis]|uniref:Protease HtpX homolog n=1 Tax=Salinactinospora qingdaonensis TaxID=702744 RepID=A0ABP7G042_9ACTN